MSNCIGLEINWSGLFKRKMPLLSRVRNELLLVYSHGTKLPMVRNEGFSLFKRCQTA